MTVSICIQYTYKRTDCKMETKLNISSFCNCTAIQIILHHSANLLTLCACIKHLLKLLKSLSG